MRTPLKFTRLLYISLWVLIVSVSSASLPTVLAQASTGQSRIAFVTSDYDTRTMTISLADPESGIVTPLVVEGNFAHPVLSPDGKHLAFWGEEPLSRKSSIFIIDTDGSNLRPLIDPQSLKLYKLDGKVAWSADSTQILYGIRDRDNDIDGFFRVNLDSGDRERIEFPDITEPFYDTWITSSGDGSHLAVIVQSLEQPYVQLYITDGDGSNARPVTAALGNGQSPDELVWSPDNKYIVLNVSILNALEPLPLMIAESAESQASVLIPAPPNYINSVAWSPDGRQLTFLAAEMSASGIPDGEVYVASAEGYDIRALNIPINVAYVGTSWSIIPDEVVLPDSPTSFREAQ